MRKFVPGQNLFYLRWLCNQVEDATGDKLNLPPSKETQPRLSAP